MAYAQQGSQHEQGKGGQAGDGRNGEGHNLFPYLRGGLQADGGQGDHHEQGEGSEGGNGGDGHIGIGHGNDPFKNEG